MEPVSSASRRLLEERGPLSHGFYTSGQLFLEEYYALAIIGKAGIGTPHMDGNTRLCTATAAAAMKESFGADGQPGSYADIDECDAIFLYGHNMAETQTVLWSRVLDRIAGPDRPIVVCVDPRDTEVARHADVHLAVRPGTNLALMNGLIRELFAHGWIDERVRRGAHPRRRRTPGDGRAVDARGGRQGRAASPAADMRRGSADLRHVGAGALHGAAGLLPVLARPRRRPARSTTCTCCAGCWAGRGAGSCR